MGAAAYVVICFVSHSCIEQLHMIRRMSRSPNEWLWSFLLVFRVKVWDSCPVTGLDARRGACFLKNDHLNDRDGAEARPGEIDHAQREAAAPVAA